MFVQSLKEQFRVREMFSSHGRQISMQTLYIDSNIGNMTNQDFEFVILESALANIVNKFRYKDILFDNCRIVKQVSINPISGGI